MCLRAIAKIIENTPLLTHSRAFCLPEKIHARANRSLYKQKRSKGHCSWRVRIIFAHPTSAINISPVFLSKLYRHGLRNPIAQISFGVVVSLLPKHELLFIQGLSGGDVQVLEVKLDTSTRSILPISDLFVVWMKIRGYA